MQSAETRFWTKVSVGSQGKCWPWLAAKSPAGYGYFWDGTRNIGAHRFSYQMVNGQIPPHLQIDHLCRNPSCVNPEHLEAVTGYENIRRGTSLIALNTRKESCERGHPFTPENTQTVQGHQRACRECRREERRRWHQRADRTEPPKHGLTGYVHYRCRCDVCRQANMEYRHAIKAKVQLPNPESETGDER